MTFAITGASGRLGRLAAAALLDRVDPADVVLLSRDPARLADLAARGATVRAADFTDPDSLPGALAGVDRLLLISVDLFGQARQHAQRAMIDAASRSAIAKVVYTSLPRPTADNPVSLAADHRDTEDYLRASGLRSVVLRNNLYADMQIDTIRRAADEGRLVTNNGAGRAAYVSREDCAAAAVGALTGDAIDVTLDITGPEALGSRELADLASKLTDRPVEVVDVDDAQFADGLRSSGLPEQIVDVATGFGTAIREGWLDEVTTAVRDLSGAEPVALRELI